MRIQVQNFYKEKCQAAHIHHHRTCHGTSTQHTTKVVLDSTIDPGDLMTGSVGAGAVVVLGTRVGEAAWRERGQQLRTWTTDAGRGRLTPSPAALTSHGISVYFCPTMCTLYTDGVSPTPLLGVQHSKDNNNKKRKMEKQQNRRAFVLRLPKPSRRQNGGRRPNIVRDALVAGGGAPCQTRVGPTGLAFEQGGLAQGSPGPSPV